MLRKKTRTLIERLTSGRSTIAIDLTVEISSCNDALLKMVIESWSELLCKIYAANAKFIDFMQP